MCIIRHSTVLSWLQSQHAQTGLNPDQNDQNTKSVYHQQVSWGVQTKFSSQSVSYLYNSKYRQLSNVHNRVASPRPQKVALWPIPGETKQTNKKQNKTKKPKNPILYFDSLKSCKPYTSRFYLLHFKMNNVRLYNRAPTWEI